MLFDPVILTANRWQTTLTPDEFQKVTEVEGYPSNLSRYVDSDSLLQLYANGEINYRLNGVHPEWEKMARISKYWLTSQALKVTRENE